jgi:periplasmic divalent cation tolerance protein
MTQHYLAITSWPDLDGARHQANRWVQNKLAAGVNVLPQMDSIHVWIGELQHGREHKIFIKTGASNLYTLQG